MDTEIHPETSTSTRIILLTGGKTAGKTTSAIAAKMRLPVSVIHQDDAIRDLKVERRDRLAELPLPEETTGALLKCGFLDEPDSTEFLQRWYERNLTDAESPVVIVEGWLFEKVKQRHILYKAADQVFESPSFHLALIEPTKADAAGQFEKRKCRPPDSGEIERRMRKNRRNFERPKDEPLETFKSVASSHEFLAFVEDKTPHCRG